MCVWEFVYVANKLVQAAVEYRIHYSLFRSEGNPINSQSTRARSRRESANQRLNDTRQKSRYFGV